jgi:hypothetical protein
MECGLRLDSAEPDPVEPGQPVAAPPKPRRTWIWTALGGLAVAAAGAAVAIAVSGNGGSTTLTMTTTIAPVTTTAPAATDPGAVAPQPTTPTAPATTAATTPSVPEPAQKPPNKQALIAWPGRTAYTVVLASLPAPGGHAAALARAHQAVAKGLRQVGVLDSGGFASLNPGYYVVFSGVYKTLVQAETGARNARFAGFGSAYPRQIVP